MIRQREKILVLSRQIYSLRGSKLELSIDKTTTPVLVWIEGDNGYDEYYVPIQTRLGRIIVNPNRFGQAAVISLGFLTFQCNSFLQNSQPGPIKTIKNELENVSIFKSTMDHMYLISRNSDDGSINLVDPRILAEETSQKDNLHLEKSMKADDCEVLLKSKEK